MSINSFDDGSTGRISRTVRQYEHSPRQAPAYRRKTRPSPSSKKNSVFPIEIITGENGVYQGYKVDPNTGLPTDEIIDVFATRATAYDLAATKRAVGFVVKVDTMA